MTGGTDGSGPEGLGEVAGVPETVLSAGLLASLPRTAPPAPWTVTCDAVVWVARPTSAAAEVLASELRGSRVAAVVGGIVRYSATPVGPYTEVLGAVGGLRGPSLWASVPFMAVDSEPSLVAGRRNWALPKTLGVVERSPRVIAVRGAGSLRWLVTVTSTEAGPSVPVRGGTTLRQVSSGSVVTSRLTASGRFRPAVVRVGVASEGPLAEWLRPGSHLGGVLTGVRFTLDRPDSPDDRGEPHGGGTL